MVSAHLPVKALGEFDPVQPYTPFVAAEHEGTLPVDKEPVPVEQLARPFETPPGVLIRNGYVPNHEGKGVVDLGNGHFGAFDHVAIRFDGNRLIVMPSSKAQVRPDGKILGEGAVVFESARADAWLGMAALVLDVAQHPWLAGRMHGPADLGGLAIIPGNALDMPRLQLVDDTNPDELLYEFPNRIFGFLARDPE